MLINYAHSDSMASGIIKVEGQLASFLDGYPIFADRTVFKIIIWPVGSRSAIILEYVQGVECSSKPK